MKYEHRDFYFLVAGVLDSHDKNGGSAESTLSTIKKLHTQIGLDILSKPAETNNNDPYAVHSADQCDDPTCSHY